MSRTPPLTVVVALLHFLHPCGLVAQEPDSAFALVTRQIAQDTDRLTRFMYGHALWRSGIWKIEGEYKGPTGVFYKATGYWTFVLSRGVLATGQSNAVLALYLEPYAGGQAFWLGASLDCDVKLTPTSPEPVHCLVEEGATALLDVNFSLSPAVFFRFQEVAVGLTEPEDKNPSKRWTARASSRGCLRLIPVDRTASWPLRHLSCSS